MPLLGDALVLAGAACYAVSNVVQEKLLGEAVGVVELLAMIGSFGALFAGAQVRFGGFADWGVLLRRCGRDAPFAWKAVYWSVEPMAEGWPQLLPRA